MNTLSNVLYDNIFYNEAVKEKYLIETGVTPSIIRIFKASFDLEHFYGKDLYDFNREELRKLLFVLKPTKINSSYLSGMAISRYIDWSIAKGYRKLVNPLSFVARDWYEQFTIEVNTYFTEDFLEEVIKSCKNAQDAVIVCLLKEGIRGEANEEILNLRKNDINFETNELSLRDDINKTKRILTVSDNCIRLCRQALNESEYEKLNGETDPNIKTPTTKLVDNEFVIKTSLTNAKSIEKADKNIIHRRISMLASQFNEPYFTPMNISYSGMLIMARNIYIKKGRLDYEDYNRIFDTFGYRNVSQENSQTYYRLKDEFLNVIKLKELYNI